MFAGRNEETARLRDAFAAASAGDARVVVVRGEPGVGKTAVVAAAIAAFDGARVLSVAGEPSEAHLAFGGLLGLLRPILGSLDEIPEPQAEALRGAFALGPAVGADAFAVAAATLSLLTAAARARPLVVWIDDLQWVDAGSITSLLFAARRLRDDAVAVVIVVRDGEAVVPRLSGFEELVISGIDAAVATEMLGGRGLSLAPTVVDALVQRTHGNPLAIGEVAHGLDDFTRLGVRPLGVELPVGEGVEQAFLARVHLLPESTRRALTIAALASSDDARVVARVIEDLGGAVDDLAAAEGADLVRLSVDRVTFAHPLVRAALVHAARPDTARTIHRALARAYDAAGASEKGVWHAADAALDPDDAVAERLEDVSEQAAARGDLVTASLGFARAAALTTTSAERATRNARAGFCGAASGTDGDGLLEAAYLESADEHLRSAVAVVRTQVAAMKCDHELATRLADEYGLAFASNPTVATAVDALASISDWMAADIPALTRRVEAAWDRYARDGIPLEEIPLDDVPTLSAAMTLAVTVSMSRSINGRSDVALARRCGAIVIDRELAPVASAAAMALLLCDDLELAQAVHRGGLARARSGGAVADILSLQGIGAALYTRIGELDTAYAYGTEAVELGSAAGEVVQLGQAQSALAFVDALRGDGVSCDARVAVVHELADEFGAEVFRLLADFARAMLDESESRVDPAISRLTALVARLRARGFRGLSNTPALAELCETLARARRLDEARDAYKVLTEDLADETVPGPAGVLARAAAVIGAAESSSAPGTVDDAFARALDMYTAMGAMFEVARTELYWGEYARRSGRRNDAARLLQSAAGRFEAMGAAAWRGQADRELASLGIRPRPERIAGDALTPREHQVAQLAATGMSTREIATNLFVSPKTVEAHLTATYRKLGLTSRAQLAHHFHRAG